MDGFGFYRFDEPQLVPAGVIGSDKIQHPCCCCQRDDVHLAGFIGSGGGVPAITTINGRVYTTYLCVACFEEKLRLNEKAA